MNRERAFTEYNFQIWIRFEQSENKIAKDLKYKFRIKCLTKSSFPAISDRHFTEKLLRLVRCRYPHSLALQIKHGRCKSAKWGISLWKKRPLALFAHSGSGNIAVSSSSSSRPATYRSLLSPCNSLSSFATATAAAAAAAAAATAADAGSISGSGRNSRGASKRETANARDRAFLRLL